MTPERWAEIDRVWHTVLARPEAERATAVDQLCGGDHELRAEVVALLANLAQASAAGFGAAPGISTRSGSLVGQRLGSYAVHALLGVGGMGEVYQAHDSTLGRDVALKLLPDLWHGDPDRRARFDREARVLASLNHPNVGAIYGVQDSEGVKALVLELVEGETLADRILHHGPRRGLPIDEVTAIAAQIIDALEAAHERGIVHRDLKPGNIKITPEGRVKVLDFGLARAVRGGGSSPSLAHSPTITAVGTQQGVLLGTAAYMSPEQARGRTVDKRTDIWAFGCVLFEMLAGSSAFPGDSVADTLAAVIHKEPDWSTLPPATPPSIRRVLHRCLQKDPAKRLRDIADAAHEMLEASVDEPNREQTHSQTSTRLTSWRLVAALATLGTLVGAAVLWVSLPSKSVTVTKMIVGGPAGRASAGEFALAPDGSRFVYVGADRRLWVQELDDLESRALAGTDKADAPFFSPDGLSVAFVTGGALKVVPIQGGSVRTVAADSTNVVNGDWAADGTLYFNRVAQGLWKVASSGGSVELVSRPTTVGVVYRSVDVLPNGKGAFLTIDSESINTSKIQLLDFATGEVESLFPGTQARFATSGHIVYVTADGTLHAAPFDQNRLRVTGSAVSLIERVDLNLYQAYASFALSDKGTLLYRQQAQQQSEVVWVTKDGTATPLTPDAWVANFFSLSLSPDGRQVAVSLTTGRRQEVWTRSLDTGTTKRLTFENEGSLNYRARWTADGRALTFVSNRSGTAGELWFQRVDGTARAERLAADGPIIDEGLLSPDGQWAVYRAGGSDLVSRDIKAVQNGKGGNSTPKALVATPSEEYSPSLSADGRWLAYVSEESGRPEIYVRPFPAADTAVWQVSRSGGSAPVWAASGRQLFYVNQSAEVVAVATRGSATFEWDPPKVLFDASGYYLHRLNATYDVTPDGERFLMLRRVGGAGGELVLTLNWFEEMTRKLAGR